MFKNRNRKTVFRRETTGACARVMAGRMERENRDTGPWRFQEWVVMADKRPEFVKWIKLLGGSGGA